MKFTHLSHCVYHCDYHIVIVTKYRKGIFDEGIFTYLEKKLAEIVEHYPLVQFGAVNHDKDHVHILVSIPPTMAVGKVVGIIKQNTSRGLKQKFPFLKQVYWGTDAVWSEGYLVSTVGIDEDIIRAYVEDQGKKDAGQTKFETPTVRSWEVYMAIQTHCLVERMYSFRVEYLLEIAEPITYGIGVIVHAGKSLVYQFISGASGEGGS